MPEDASRIESRLDTLETRLHALEARLAALENGKAAPSALPRPAKPAPAGTAASAGKPTASHAGDSPVLTLMGRSLVVLGGAFLLRHLTESGMLPQAVGTVVGFGYAILWMLFADRAAGHGRPNSATFHGLVGALIAYPLVVEATLKFHYLSSDMGALALLATTALGLSVAWRRHAGHLAWIISLGTIAAALVMALTSRHFFPFSVLLLLLGFATLWMAYERGGIVLAGVVAVVADLQIVLLSLVPRAAAHAGVEPIIQAAQLLTLQLGLLAVYFGSFAWRTLHRARDLRDLEVLQSVVVFSIGIGGSMALVHATGRFALLVGMVTLALGLGSYAVSFTSIDRKLGSRRNFLFYSTMALVLTVVALHDLLSPDVRALIFAILSLTTAWIGSWKHRATLSGHGAFFAVAAAAEAGLLQGAMTAFFGLDPTGSAPANAMAFVVIAVTMVNCWFDVAKHGRTWGRLSVVPKLVVLLVLCISVGGILVRELSMALGVRNGATPDLAIAGAVRTGVLALSALLLAGLSRWRRCLESAWLVYPALIFGGLKLLLEDLRQGRPATVFASLVLYGCALIVAPRLTRKLRNPSPLASPPVK